MTIEEILAGIEGTGVEFKEQDGPQFYRGLAALANSGGGVLLLGVADSRAVIGYECSNMRIKTLADTIHNTLQIHPTLTPLAVEDREILRIDVGASIDLVSYKGTFPMRVGSTTRGMTADDIRHRILSLTPWDLQTNCSPISEIDAETVSYFLYRVRKCGRLPYGDYDESSERVLHRLGLIRDNRLTNAAVLLFGSSPQRRLGGPLLRIMCTRYGSVIGEALIEGNLFVQYRRGMDAIFHMILMEAGESEEQVRARAKSQGMWDYHLRSLHEALINALIHRDYSRLHIETRVMIEERSVCIHNPGSLPHPLTVSGLKARPASLPRNPELARILALGGFTHGFGKGVEEMEIGTRCSYLPPPKFQEENGGFSVYFKKDWFCDDYLRSLGLKSRQRRALLAGKRLIDFSNEDYRILAEVNEQTARRDLADLVGRGVLIRAGTGSGTCYGFNREIVDHLNSMVLDPKGRARETVADV